MVANKHRRPEGSYIGRTVDINKRAGPADTRADDTGPTEGRAAVRWFPRGRSDRLLGEPGTVPLPKSGDNRTSVRLPRDSACPIGNRI